MLVVAAVLVINVEFSVGVVTDDDVLLMEISTVGLSTTCDMFLDNTALELVTVKVGVNIAELKIEVG